jgi:branched-chain amino acid aminotransferase
MAMPFLKRLKLLILKFFFLEDHYFRLMASMRVVRMEIPMNLQWNTLKSKFSLQLKCFPFLDFARVRITVFRNDGGIIYLLQMSLFFYQCR